LAFLFSKDLEKKWEGQPVLGRISGHPFLEFPWKGTLYDLYLFFDFGSTEYLCFGLKN